MPEPVVLPLHCAHCHGAVTLQFPDWSNLRPRTRETWACPYCGSENAGEFCARLQWVTKGHAEPSPDRPCRPGWYDRLMASSQRWDNAGTKRLEEARRQANARKREG